MYNEKNELKENIIKEKKKKTKNNIPSFLKPISKMISEMKAKKFGAVDNKPLKYKAVNKSKWLFINLFSDNRHQ